MDADMTTVGTVFLTGFPGFIAGRLLRRLAREGGRYFLLVQPDFVARAQLELQAIANETGKALSDYVVIEGDITRPNLGMSPPNLEMTRAETDIIFSLAAVYDLGVAREVGMNVNVRGTRHMNHFARTLQQLKHYHYVSTCYVAGKRTGVIYENELRHEAGFRNHYEETKYLAEVEVDALKGELPITIHRPSVVCGDSQTGETVKYDGIYYLIRYLLKWPALLSTFNIGNSDVTLNLVPVDFVVEAMATITREPAAIGKTIQLADPNPLTTRQLFNEIARTLAGREATITLPASVVEKSLTLSLSPRLTGLPHTAVPYFFLKQTYDTALAAELLAPYGVRCPPYPSYVRNIVDYAANHPAL